MRLPAFAIATFLAAAPMVARCAEPITLRYGQNAAGASGLSSLPLTVAQRKDFFSREGINLVVVPIAGGTDRIVAALDAGEIDAGKNATPYLIEAVLKGSDAVAIMSQTANPVYSLIAQPSIKTVAALKGQLVGLSTPGDTITLSTLRLLARAGLGPSDFKTKVVVGRARALRASSRTSAPQCRWARRRTWARSLQGIRALLSPTRRAATSCSTST